MYWIEIWDFTHKTQGIDLPAPWMSVQQVELHLESLRAYLAAVEVAEES